MGKGTGRGEGRGMGRGKGKGKGSSSSSSSSSSSGGKKKRKYRTTTTTHFHPNGGHGGMGGYGMAAGAGLAGAGIAGAGMMGYQHVYAKGPYNQYDQMYYDHYNSPCPSDPRGFPSSVAPSVGYPPTSYPPSNYPPSNYPPSGYPPSGYPPASYPPASYPPAGYPPAGYPPPNASGYGGPPSQYDPYAKSMMGGGSSSPSTSSTTNGGHSMSGVAKAGMAGAAVGATVGASVLASGGDSMYPPQQYSNYPPQQPPHYPQQPSHYPPQQPSHCPPQQPSNYPPPQQPQSSDRNFSTSSAAAAVATTAAVAAVATTAAATASKPEEREEDGPQFQKKMEGGEGVACAPVIGETGGRAGAGAGAGAGARAGAGAGAGIILDNGTFRCKIGFSGDEEPRDVFPALVGRPKHTQVMVGAIDGKDTFVGSDAQEKRGVLTLSYPIENGRISNWDDIELVWHHALHNGLRVDPSEHPILVTEPPLNPTKHREQMAQILFEKLNVPALYIASTATLSLYSMGITTGLVVELGHGVCHIVPVYQGYSITQGIKRVDFGGRNVTDYLKKLLAQSGYNFATTAEHEVVEHIKYQLAYVSLDPQAESVNLSAEQAKEYEMPDGQKIKVAQERFMCTEVLFDPSLIGRETPPLHYLILEAIDKCDINIRRTMLANIVLGGGSSLFPGLAERLTKELKDKLPEGAEVEIKAPPKRLFGAWHGGATLAKTDAFQPLWITRGQWEAMGPMCLHEKCYQ